MYMLYCLLGHSVLPMLAGPHDSTTVPPAVPLPPYQLFIMKHLEDPGICDMSPPLGDNPGFRQAAATRSSTSHSLNNVYLSYGTQVLARIINQNKMVNLKTRKSMLKTWMMTMRDSAMGRSNGFDMAGFQQSKPVVTMSNSNGISTMYELADAQY
nr:uncharacterized protein LOC127302243 isoform X3 [Lolium perenne]XP_051188622.1 uncharacterized protein LOC127302243 isoform X3 [Lolium perenne]